MPIRATGWKPSLYASTNRFSKGTVSGREILSVILGLVGLFLFASAVLRTGVTPLKRANITAFVIASLSAAFGIALIAGALALFNK